MGVILSYFMFLLFCLLQKVMSVYGEKENANTERILLTWLGIPLLTCLFAGMGEHMPLTSSIEEKFVFGFFECFGTVFCYVLGCCSLEYHIIGKQENKFQVFRKKGVGVILLLIGCMLFSGIAGGVCYLPEENLYRLLQDINEFLGSWMIFTSYWIITIVFVVTNITEKSLGDVLKRWKAQDGIFLLLMKLIVLGTSICAKTIFFMNIAQPLGVTHISMKYKWVSSLESALFNIQYDGSKYYLLGILPLLLGLYIVAVKLKKNTDKREDDMGWGMVILIECILTGWFGLVLWLGGWR